MATELEAPARPAAPGLAKAGAAPAPLLSVAIAEKLAGTGSRRRKILDRIRFSVARGSFVSVVGPSGCGKTTLLRCVAGLETDFDGEIAIDGRPVRGPGLERGVVFQEPRLFPWMDLRTNIAFAAERRQPGLDRRIKELLDLVGLAGFERHWPKQLSGGMAQRAALARALLNVPQLLLLDEPLGALDNFTRARMQAELRQIVQREHVTALLVTHDIDEAIMLSGQVLIMAADPGRIARSIVIDLDQPRDRNDPAFVRLRAEIDHLLSTPGTREGNQR